jgi:hypothetical protein
LELGDDEISSPVAAPLVKHHRMSSLTASRRAVVNRIRRTGILGKDILSSVRTKMEAEKPFLKLGKLFKDEMKEGSMWI